MRNVPQSWAFEPLVPVGGTVWEGLGGLALLEEQSEIGFERKSLLPLSLPVCFTPTVKDVRSQIPVHAIMPFPFWTASQVNSSVSGLGHGVLSRQQKRQGLTRSTLNLAKEDLELLTHLPQPSQYWDYRHKAVHLAWIFF
jgi:hypothetical protein